MPPKPASQSQEEEKLKAAAAFAFGRALAMLGATGQQKYLEQVKRLQAELQAMDCLNYQNGFAVKEAWFKYQVDGAFHAAEELEKLGL